MRYINKVKKVMGFTLVEIIAVIAIIVILMGFLYPALNTAREQAKKQEARAMIGSLEVALSMYYTDFGFYPDEASGSNNFGNTLGVAQGSYGPYIEFKSGEVNSSNAVEDPWGSAYRYDKSSPPNNQATFDLWSIGSGKTISNW